MKQLTVRHVSPELARALKDEKRRRSASLNQTILDLLHRALGLQPAARYDNGLGRLAGGWTEEELAGFEAHTASFEQIDEDLWK